VLLFQVSSMGYTILVTHLGYFYFFIGHCKNYCLELDLGHSKLLHSKFLFLINVIYFMFHLMCILMMGAPICREIT